MCSRQAPIACPKTVSKRRPAIAGCVIVSRSESEQRSVRTVEDNQEIGDGDSGAYDRRGVDSDVGGRRGGV